MDSSAFVRYLTDHAPILFLTLGRDGSIFRMNRYAARFLGGESAFRYFQDILVNFNDSFDMAEAVDSEDALLLSIASADGDLQSFYFHFLTQDDCPGTDVLAFGHTDAEDFSLMQGEIVNLNQQLSNMTRDLQKKNAKLEMAMEQVRQLQGIIPICMHCHKIRNDQEIWEQLEAYLYEHTDAQLSHGICPDCMEKYYTED